MTDPELDPDRRAWHRAQGADGPDEAVAAELVRSSDRAQRRGGAAAAAAFFQRATELTPDPAQRATRALAAAMVTLRAGAFETVSRLLVTAEEVPLGALHRARVNLLRGQLAFASGHSLDAPPLLLEVAHQFEPLDLDLARDTCLDAMTAAQFGGRMAGKIGLAETARAALALPKPELIRKRDLVLEGAATLYTEGYPAAVAPGKKAIEAFSGADGAPDQDDLRWLWLAALLAVNLWDDDGWEVLTARHVRIARETGDLNELPLVLNHRVILNLFAAEISTAASLVAEIKTVNDATGVGLTSYGAVCLAAWRGHPKEARPVSAACLEESTSRGEGGGITIAHFGNAVLLNGLAQHEEALVEAQAATVFPQEFGLFNWSLSELIEAASRCGRPELAADGFDRLSVMMQACGTDWGLGVLARSKALLTTAREPAESAYQEAIHRLGPSRMRMDLARAHLVYGEWLRQGRRRQDARVELRTAYKMFAVAGADAFADRASRELAATGEAVGIRANRATDSLTPQEAHIAELAATGLTNAEIGAQLFLSRHTVDWHLRKVFQKLGITSRKQLR